MRSRDGCCNYEHISVATTDLASSYEPLGERAWVCYASWNRITPHLVTTKHGNRHQLEGKIQTRYG